MTVMRKDRHIPLRVHLCALSIPLLYVALMANVVALIWSRSFQAAIIAGFVGACCYATVAQDSGGIFVLRRMLRLSFTWADEVMTGHAAEMRTTLLAPLLAAACCGCSPVPEQEAAPPWRDDLGELVGRTLAATAESTLDIKTLVEESEQGDPEARCRLGMLLLDGKGVAKDREAAYGWFKAAAQDNAEAAFQAGLCLAYGRGVWQSFPAACDQFLSAARMGHVGAAVQAASYAMMTASGTKTKEAFRLLRGHAEGGNAEAQNLLGMALLTGTIGEADEEEGFLWLKRAAAQGHRDAKMIVAKCYLSGTGTPTNDAAAVRELETLDADGGDAEASHMLGICLLEGIGTAADEEAAIERISAAARAGEPGAAEDLEAVLQVRRESRIEDAFRAFSDPGDRSPSESGDLAMVIDAVASYFLWHPTEAECDNLVRACRSLLDFGPPILPERFRNPVEGALFLFLIERRMVRAGCHRVRGRWVGEDEWRRMRQSWSARGQLAAEHQEEALRERGARIEAAEEYCRSLHEMSKAGRRAMKMRMYSWCSNDGMSAAIGREISKSGRERARHKRDAERALEKYRGGVCRGVEKARPHGTPIFGQSYRRISAALGKGLFTAFSSGRSKSIHELPGMTICIVYINDTAEWVNYSKKNGSFTDNEVQQILRSNAQGRYWGFYDTGWLRAGFPEVMAFLRHPGVLHLSTKSGNHAWLATAKEESHSPSGGQSAIHSEPRISRSASYDISPAASRPPQWKLHERGPVAGVRVFDENQYLATHYGRLGGVFDSYTSAKAKADALNAQQTYNVDALKEAAVMGGSGGYRGDWRMGRWKVKCDEKTGKFVVCQM